MHNTSLQDVIPFLISEEQFLRIMNQMITDHQLGRFIAESNFRWFPNEEEPGDPLEGGPNDPQEGEPEDPG